MRVYSYSEARQNLAEMLNHARREGQVEIRRRDGQRFLIRPTHGAGSPLDVPGVDAGLSREEIVDLVRESRQSTERLQKVKSSPDYRLRSLGKNRRRLSRIP
jgi:hypothetical protein